MGKRAQSWRVSAAASLALSCTPELPHEHHTEHLEIYSELEAPFCAGDLNSLEDIFTRVGTELKLDTDRLTRVYVWSDDTWGSIAEQKCGRQAEGCWAYSNNTIHTSEVGLRHEIVHAAIGLKNLDPFFGEALAGVYSGTEVRFGSTKPSENAGVTEESVDTRTAQHFLMWLREEWGSERIGQLVRMKGGEFENFAAVYGLTVETAEELYFVEAPFGYSSIYACEGGAIAQPDLDEPYWWDEIILDCVNGEDVRSHGSPGMSARRIFDITESGYYTITHSGDAIIIHRCGPDRIEDAIPLGAHLFDDVPPYYGGFPSGLSRYYEGQGSQDLYMEAGRHSVAIGLFGHEAGLVEIEIFPTLGPHPLPAN